MDKASKAAAKTAAKATKTAKERKIEKMEAAAAAKAEAEKKNEACPPPTKIKKVTLTIKNKGKEAEPQLEKASKSTPKSTSKSTQEAQVGAVDDIEPEVPNTTRMDFDDFAPSPTPSGSLRADPLVRFSTYTPGIMQLTYKSVQSVKPCSWRGRK